MSIRCTTTPQTRIQPAQQQRERSKSVGAEPGSNGTSRTTRVSREDSVGVGTSHSYSSPALPQVISLITLPTN
jgi:hypothetical protein